MTAAIIHEVVESVAATTGQDVDALPPLHDAVDPDALESLFSPLADETPRGPGTVTFAYAGCEVTVRVNGEGNVRVEATPA